MVAPFLLKPSGGLEAGMRRKGGPRPLPPAASLHHSCPGDGANGYRTRLREARRRSLGLDNIKSFPQPAWVAAADGNDEPLLHHRAQKEKAASKQIAPKKAAGIIPGNKEGTDSVEWRSDPSRLFGYKLFGPHAKESFENLVRKVEIASGPNQSDPKGFGVVARVALKKGTLIMDPTTKFFNGHPSEHLEADDCIHVPSRRGSGWSHGYYLLRDAGQRISSFTYFLNNADHPGCKKPVNMNWEIQYGAGMGQFNGRQLGWRITRDIPKRGELLVQYDGSDDEDRPPPPRGMGRTDYDPARQRFAEHFHTLGLRVGAQTL